MEKNFTIKILNVGKSQISGNIYTETAVSQMIDEFNSRNEETGQWGFGEIKALPDDPTPINLENVSHKIIKLYLKENAVWAEIEILNTPHGKILQSFDSIYPHPIMRANITNDRLVEDDLILETLHLTVQNPATWNIDNEK